MNLQNLGVQEMNAKEINNVDGGNKLTGYYYGQEYNAETYEALAHELGDFFRGVYDGLSSLWN